MNYPKNYKMKSYTYIKKNKFNELYWRDICKIGNNKIVINIMNYTVQQPKNRIVQWEIGWLKVQEVILPNHDLKFSVQQSIPQLRKSHNLKSLVTCQFFGTGFQSQNFREIGGRFWLRMGQLWTRISRLLFGICSAYMYSFERSFS
jgi:hypothetical protein